MKPGLSSELKNPNSPSSLLTELQHSEARFKAMFETSAVGIGIMGLDRKIIDANPAMCQMLGISHEEIIGQSPQVATYPEDYIQSTAEWEELLAGKRDYFWSERRYMRKNGEIFWAHITMSVVRDADRKPLYMVGMVIDIDERKRAVIELRESEKRFRATFESSAIGIGILSLDGKIMQVNAAVCAMSGYNEAELQQRYDSQNVYPEDLNVGAELFEELLAGKRDSYNVEKRYVRKNGEVFWVLLTLSAVRDDDRNPIYLVGLIEDIDEQKRTLAELQESEARFRAIYDHAEMGIVIANLDENTASNLDDDLFRVLIAHQRFNPALQRMFGYSETELQSMDVAALIYPEDRGLDAELSRQLFAGERDAYRAEMRYLRKDGSVFWGRLNYSLVRSADGKPRMAIGIIEDIDQEKQAQEHLRESEARFRAMFDNAAVGMSLMSLDRRVVKINQIAERIIGYKFEELIDVDPINLSHPEDREIGLSEFREMVAGKRQGFFMEKRYIRKNGEVFLGRISYSVVPDKYGNPEYMVGMIEDITEQKLAAEKLATRERENLETLETLEQRVEERTRALKEANLRLVAEIEQRQLAEESLATKAVEEAIVTERTRLARELHDAVTQTLFSASLIAEVLPDLWAMDENEAKNSTEELRQLTRGALAEMRTLLLELRPAALLQARFPDLLKQLVEAVVGRTRLPVKLDVVGDDELPPDVQVALYRIAQESLNNIVKYARATQVTIALNQSCCHVELEISDNGVGFDLSTIKPTSLGLRIMRERAESIGARFQINSAPGDDTQVSVIWDEDGTNEAIP